MDAYESTQIETEQYKTSMGVLKKYFGYDTFKENQYKIIHNILNCKDVIALLPTSHGKSLCFQIIPLITNEVCIVISPLISLMEDQKMILDKLNIESCCYNGTSNAKQKEEIEKDVLDNKYKIIYTTPETLINSKNFIEKIFRKIGICVLAIDESHCVSSFGYDFRPAYRSIIDIKKLLKGVPVLALTATATKDVIEDIKTELKIKKCEIIRSSFNRTNLKINVREQTKETKDEIVSIIENISVGSIIIYCVTRKDTEKMTEFLKENKIKMRRTLKILILRWRRVSSKQTLCFKQLNQLTYDFRFIDIFHRAIGVLIIEAPLSFAFHSLISSRRNSSDGEYVPEVVG